MSGVIRLYSLQQSPVRRAIEEDGVCYSKQAYVEKKYGESAPLFVHNYRWFVSRAAALLPPPEGASFPYWAFRDLYNIEGSPLQENCLTLEVPTDQAVFFDAADWTRIMQLRPLCGDPAEERRIRDELTARGITAQKAVLSSFYPDLRQTIVSTWDRLFRHHEEVLAGDFSGCEGGVQAGLWCIRRDWVIPGTAPKN